MIKHFTNFIIRITNIKTIALFVVAVIIIEIGFSMFLPVFVEATGGKLLDMSVKYSAVFAYERLTTFNKAADVYLKIRIIDSFFPIFYAFALSLISSIVYRKKYKDPNNYRWVLLMPFLAAIFDYIENIILVILYHSLPTQYLSVAKILNILSILKFSFLGLSVMLIITGAFALLKGSDSMFLMGNTFKGKKKD